MEEQLQLFPVPQEHTRIRQGQPLASDLRLVPLPRHIDELTASPDQTISSKQILKDSAVVVHACNCTIDRLTTLSSKLRASAVIIFLDEENLPILSSSSSDSPNTTPTLCKRRITALRSYLSIHSVETAVFFARTILNKNILPMLSGTYIPHTPRDHELYSTDVLRVTLPTATTPLLPSPILSLVSSAALKEAADLSNWLASTPAQSTGSVLRSVVPTVFITAQYQDIELVPGLVHGNITEAQSTLPLLLLTAKKALDVRSTVSVTTQTQPESSPQPNQSSSTPNASPSSSAQPSASATSTSDELSSISFISLTPPISSSERLTNPATKLTFMALPAPLHASLAMITQEQVLSQPHSAVAEVLSRSVHIHLATERHVEGREKRGVVSSDVNDLRTCSLTISTCASAGSREKGIRPLLAIPFREILMEELKMRGVVVNSRDDCPLNSQLISAPMLFVASSNVTASCQDIISSALSTSVTRLSFPRWDSLATAGNKRENGNVQEQIRNFFPKHESHHFPADVSESVSNWINHWKEWLSIPSTPQTVSVPISCTVCPQLPSRGTVSGSAISQSSRDMESLTRAGNYTILELVSNGLKSMEGIGKNVFHSEIPNFDRFGVKLWGAVGSAVVASHHQDDEDQHLVVVPSPSVMYTVKDDQVEFMVSVAIGLYLFLLAKGFRSLIL